MELIKRNTGYGLRALLHMALHLERHSFTADELAEAAETTSDFMHKILLALRDAGIVSARRGRGGGFSLAKPPQDVSVLAAIEATQGPMSVNRCVLGLDVCHRSGTCPLRPTWLKVQAEMEQALAETSLADVVGTAVCPAD